MGFVYMKITNHMVYTQAGSIPPPPPLLHHGKLLLMVRYNCLPSIEVFWQ